MTFRQKPIHQMRPEKTRASGDDGNGLGTFGHFGCVLIAAAEVYQQEVTANGAVVSGVLSGYVRRPSIALRTAHPTAFVLRLSFGIRHSAFVIYLLPCAFCPASSPAVRCTSVIILV